MTLARSQFERELKDLRDHVNFLEKIINDIDTHSTNYPYSKSSTRKKYDYTSVIISLYGMVESYTEKFLAEYLGHLEKNIFLYDYLDAPLKEAHFSKSLLLLNKIIEGKHQKYFTIKKEIVLENINNCITQANPFVINKEAFFINTGNLKHSKICEIFNNVNINLDTELRQFKIFKIKSENVFNSIDDLVARRNEIAHGAITEIADNSIIYPLIDFVETYFLSINDVLLKKFYNDLNTFKKNVFGYQIKDYKIFKGNILGLSLPDSDKITDGVVILIQKANNVVVCANILEKKAFANGVITIKLDKNFKNNCSFYSFNPIDYNAKLIK